MRAMRLAPPRPQLWIFFCHDWLRLDAGLARAWWFALSHARWSQSAAWREQFVRFARQDGVVSRE
jgi:hypothetical protein